MRKPLPSGAVLEGTSSEVPAGERPVDASRAPADATTESDVRLEPRREIWFKRRVRLGPAMRELWSFRELVYTLAERDLRVRYKQAVLGIAWAVIVPVALMIAFTVIINKFAKVNTHGAPYALFSYLGLLPWTFFSSTMQQGGMSLVGNVGLLNKLYCPREVFPIAAMADATIDSLIATFVLVLLFPITGFAPKIQVFWLPLLLIVLIAFTLGVTLAVSVVTVFMRDLRLVLPVVIQMGLFITPVLYDPQKIFKSTELLVGYSFINPLVPVLDGMRRCILYGQAPNWPSLAGGAVGATLYLIGGYVLFKRLETNIADVA